MGKRSNFERRERDFYPTPPAAVLPLVPHLERIGSYWEPCAGGWHLVGHLGELCDWLECVGTSDIVPCSEDTLTHDARTVYPRRESYDAFITNPPWPQRGGEPTVSIALNLSDQAPTWLLLSADFCHNRYFAKLADRCVKIVSVGRVSWMENCTAGKDNCAWYLFDARHKGATAFIARQAA